ncbi:MAG: succinyl-diaminopimelate desuccinylase, partial [Proteobacteria bacterium]|nr:succinyl-diaminopimelate desuccinylase [Pseudomonadota bacterium]
MLLDAVKLSQDLIKCPSVTQTDAGVIKLLEEKLSNMGFECDILQFEGDGSYPVTNIHALYNPSNSKNILYFAGHTDVVPQGDEALWTYPPFAAQIVDDTLYGRGAVDMKCAIASFVAAVSEFISQNKKPDFAIGLLITGDEEADAVNGTKKMLNWMKEKGKKMSACIVGEPTNPSKVGEMVKIGRRGSVNFQLKVIGKQGHVAYPENANNPITSLVNLLKILKDHRLDEGNKYFDPSNLEITDIGCSALGSNVIPEDAHARFNIRFNDEHSSQSLISFIEYACEKAVGKNSFQLTSRVSGESFITNDGFLSDIVSAAIKNKTKIKTDLSTTGGTSDARFIKDFCPVVEFGLINKTAHQIDEHA